MRIAMMGGIMRRTFFFLFFVGMIAGCVAAIGPVSSPEYSQLVAKATPKQAGEMRYYGPGNWYPYIRGFADIRSRRLADPIPGVLVITQTAILFQQWDKPTQKFEIIKLLLFSHITEVSLDTYGLNRRLVLRKKDYSFDTFDFTKAKGNFVDGTKVEEAFNFLKDQIMKPSNILSI